ncbi:MAG: M20/M25/M40 family metallo-hydrolase, partial [Pseudomonadota bacterium]
MLNDVLSTLDSDLDDSVDRLFALLRIPSISTDPAYADQCQAAAKWLVDDLTSIGFDASVRQTPGHPMVVAHHDGPNEDAPHVLFYGHYDVQPVDPLDLWETDPFAPAVAEQDGVKVITGRGASDDKGQLMTFVEACRAYKRVHGQLPCRVSILFEGEEESGSPSLKPFLEANADELKADFALVCDTNMWDRETPAISAGLRGLVGEEITVKAADRDLHSGYFGGAAANPIHILSKALADLHSDDGSVTVPDFYDGVEETPEDVKASWNTLGKSDEAFLGSIGLKHPSGERGRSVLELTWARPTCEVNGIWGGYTGEGFKTVIAAQASAKVSFRLVGKQDPEAIRNNFRDFIRARIPADCSVEFHEHGGSP